MMKIGFDLTWITKESQPGGVVQCSLRLVQALTTYSGNNIVVIVNDGCEAHFDKLRGFTTFRLVIFSQGTTLGEVVEQEHLDVVHTPLQILPNLTLSVPMMVTLHDLQPFHLPEFFTPEEIAFRNTFYRKAAEFSERVMVSFQHVKDDIVRFYDIPTDKIDVCTMGMPELATVTPSLIALVREKYALPEKYLFYSANTWRHKNHIGLLHGLKLLHEKYALDVPLICTGYQTPDFFPQIEAAIKELGLTDKVSFLGYLPEEEMPAILSVATLAVIPTLYEAGSYPLMEAMVLGVPVICATTTSLPDTIGDPRFVFDPHLPEDMAEKMALMLTDEALCRENLENSRIRVSEATWERRVKFFEASYRKAIDDFAQKKKNRWYHDWASNFEFLINDKHSKDMQMLKDQHGNETQYLRERVAEVERIKNLLNEADRMAQRLTGSFSWQITKPLRKLADWARRCLQ